MRVWENGEWMEQSPGMKRLRRLEKEANERPGNKKLIRQWMELNNRRIKAELNDVILLARDSSLTCPEYFVKRWFSLGSRAFWEKVGGSADTIAEGVAERRVKACGNLPVVSIDKWGIVHCVEDREESLRKSAREDAAENEAERRYWGGERPDEG